MDTIQATPDSEIPSDHMFYALKVAFISYRSCGAARGFRANDRHGLLHTLKTR